MCNSALHPVCVSLASFPSSLVAFPLCRYAGFECDYSRYPGPQAAAAFIRSYLAAGGDPAVRQPTGRVPH